MLSALLPNKRRMKRGQQPAQIREVLLAGGNRYKMKRREADTKRRLEGRPFGYSVRGGARTAQNR